MNGVGMGGRVWMWVGACVDATSLALGIAMNLAETEGTDASEALTASNNPLAVASGPDCGLKHLAVGR